ncbi:MAG: NAD(P)/FAD-dependent oxidoreductase [Leptolyngbya sp. PLA3]|nr:MAG: NAD(P)/FAD-dependent oxidoreductase [Cyanobacteria bacterium CYA]MCE7968462.1 NAD(P)/FAD-dependent oxidoreductase [Leptolyngbya sp. PL-A3]
MGILPHLRPRTFSSRPGRAFGGNISQRLPYTTNAHPANSRHILIVGGGFAGLACARALARAPVRITLVDRNNHHLFQPLLYQVATAALSPADIAAPIRGVLRRNARAEVLLAEVESIDAEARRVVAGGRTLTYDTLVLASGTEHSYFGHEEWEASAPGLKSIDEALEIRRRMLLGFERAENEPDADERRRLMTFVIVGGGPTGVEMAGAIGEIATCAIPRDFRHIDTRSARIVLIEAGPRLLPAFPEELSARAQRDLESIGVEVRTNTRVTDISPEGAMVGDALIGSRHVIWAAGVRASSLTAQLPCERDRSGRVLVGPDLCVPGHPEVFVLGDIARVVDPKTGLEVPGVAPAAMQMGRYAARQIDREARGVQTPAERPAFVYRDKGLLATIGRGKAVAAIGKSRFAGLPAWLLWALVHVYFLINFRNRLSVMLGWAWAYLFFERGARLITGQRVSQPRG